MDLNIWTHKILVDQEMGAVLLANRDGWWDRVKEFVSSVGFDEDDNVKENAVYKRIRQIFILGTLILVDVGQAQFFWDEVITK